VIAVKAPAMAEVAQAIRPLLGPETLVLTAMNGVPWWFFQGFGGRFAGTRLKSIDPEGAIAEAVPARHIVGCVVHASCALRAPGHVQHHFGNKLIIGEPSGEKTQRVQRLAALLAEAGFETVLSEQIQKDAWYKLWGNMTVNPVSAMTGATTNLILDDDLVRGFVGQAMLEAREIGARLGIPIEQQPEDRHQVTRKLGALTGVPTPFTDALLGLARLHARVHGLY
jgi:2-dehydropantoate 2-reductase